MPTRIASTFALPPADDPLRPNYATNREDHQFAKQYANLYWLRLVVLRKRVLERARRRWEEEGKLKGTIFRGLSTTVLAAGPLRGSLHPCTLPASRSQRVEARRACRAYGLRRPTWLLVPFQDTTPLVREGRAEPRKTDADQMPTALVTRNSTGRSLGDFPPDQAAYQVLQAELRLY